MKKEEFIESIVLNDKLINIGLDDNGQCYFVEWVENNKLHQESWGAYNLNYKDYVEFKFGCPAVDCPYYPDNIEIYPTINCKNKNKYGFCDHCFYQDVNWNAHKELIKLGVIDRRGNVKEIYRDYIVSKEEILNSGSENNG